MRAGRTHHRALTIATLGLLSDVALTIATDGLIEPHFRHSGGDGGAPDGSQLYSRRDAEIHADDEEVFTLIKMILKSGALE